MAKYVPIYSAARWYLFPVGGSPCTIAETLKVVVYPSKGSPNHCSRPAAKKNGVPNNGVRAVKTQLHCFTLDFRLVVQKLRREFTHARTLGGNFE